jgi:hypothetical protein
MDKRTVMKLALDWKNPPYVPSNINLIIPAEEKLQAHYSGKDLEDVLQNHMAMLVTISTSFTILETTASRIFSAWYGIAALIRI